MKKINILALILLIPFFIYSCGEEAEMDPDEMEDQEEEMGSDFTIWSGDIIMFSKPEGNDPELEQNQDRLNDEVWITRGNDGGQIYNAFSETAANRNASPAGTLWAVGDIDDIANLTFQPFRAAVGRPKDVVGKKLVMHLVEEDVYLYVRFTSWSQQKEGGFAYERASR